MAKKPPPKNYSEIFQKLSPDLIRIIYSEETSLKIAEICIRNGVEEEEKIEKIAYQIGRVLLGRLPPDKLQKTIERELKLIPSIAQRISEEIDSSIFSPVKESLDKVHGEEIIPPAKPKITPPSEEKPKAPPREDVYRELIE